MPLDDAAAYPGARRPDRHRVVHHEGVALHVAEWGDENAPPLLLAHGGFDFAGTYDVFGPRLAVGGWRAVSWDQRGHGDSGHAELYSWDADVRDAAAVMNATTTDPMPLIGHSKGGSLMLRLAESWPHRVSHLVSIDGMPSRRRQPDVAERERTRLLSTELGGWLDHRRRTATLIRKPGTIEDLARRRGRMNPRLSKDWLEYLVTVGAQEDVDGWRWKIDPLIRPGGFGPWRPEWSNQGLPGLGVPMLGLLGLVDEPMGWGTKPADLTHLLPAHAELQVFPDVGHFIHIERPAEVADLVLGFLAA